MTLKLNGTNSEAAPAYAGDDADTGLQCGTNELKLVTGGSARATVDSNGRLGIGTASPESLLHLNTDGTALRVTRGSSTGFLYNTGTSSTDATRLQGDSGPVELFTNAAQPIKFTINGSEKARLDSSGDLCLGTTSAFNTVANRTQIHINGTADNKILFGVGGTAKQNIYADATNLSIINQVGGYIRLNTNDTERMRLQSDGVVLIG